MTGRPYPLFLRPICQNFLLAAVLLLSELSPAIAQTTVPATDPLIASLATDADTVNIFDQTYQSLIPKASIYADPERKLSLALVIEKFRKGERPRSNLHDLTQTGQSGKPFWLVVPLINQSSNKSWLLDFGSELNGRRALITAGYVYDYASQTTLLNTLPNTNGPATTIQPRGSRLSLNLNQHQPALLIMYLQPNILKAPFLRLDLYPASESGNNIGSWILNQHTQTTLLLIFVGFFVAAAFLSQSISPLVIALYLAAHGVPALWGAIDVFTSPSSLWAYLDPLSTLLQNALLIAIVWLVLNQKGSRMPSPIIIICALGFHVLVATLLFIIPILAMPSIPNLVTMSAGPIIAAGLAVYHVRQGELTGVHLTIISTIQFISLVIAGFASQNLMIPSTAITMNAPLIGLMLQILFFMAALKSMNLNGNWKGQGATRSMEDEENLAKLRQVKENFDYNNLLKVIEHERKQLSDAREREAQRTEEMRLAKIHADEANRAKSAFLAVISHEIRTPMTGVMGMVRMLQGTTLTRDQNDYLGTVKESCDAMMSLLNDILDFEKIESGKLQLEKLDFDLHRLINSIATLMNGHATSKNIELKVDMNKTVPRYVIGDSMRLRQVLLNLVGNAIKFTRVGSVTIHLNSSYATDSKNKDDHQIYFSVQDTGIGIPPDAQKNIFNPFAQADKTIARRYGGTGLGLAISKRLVEAMGSQINISSREGEGTNFFFSLTMSLGNAEMVEETQNHASSTPVAETRSGLSVMVVDDNEITRRVIKALLEQNNHSVTQFGSAEEALELLQKGQRFDIIFSDVQMNGMSGYEFANHIRSQQNTAIASIPIIALTGNVDDSDIELCLQAGMNGHIAKPIDPDKFHAVIADIAKQGSAPNPPTVPHEPSVQDMERAYETVRGSKNLNPQPTPDQPVEIIEEPSPEPEPISTGPAVPFDPDMLSTLKDSLGVDQLRDMLDGLFAKADEIIGLLTTLEDPYNLADVRARAHELKGMCGNFGLVEISKLAGSIEKMARDGIQNGLDHKIMSLPPTYAVGRQAVDDWLRL
jgi:signal transduction histidine kinase/CheY-like chemotaxis protein